MPGGKKNLLSQKWTLSSFLSKHILCLLSRHPLMMRDLGAYFLLGTHRDCFLAPTIKG